MAQNAKKFYVVWVGRETGIFNDWDTCKKQVDQYPGARYKSFPSLPEALEAYDSATGKVSTTSAAKSQASSSKEPRIKLNDHNIALIDAQTKIYADGGCKPNPGPAGSGVVVFRNNEVDELWFGKYEALGTNNSAELNAFHCALKIAERELLSSTSVAIFSDSKYSISCITTWAHKWKKQGWVRKEGEIKNLALIQEIYELWLRLKGSVKVYHVAGHAGILGNELADRLSLMAIHEKEESWRALPAPYNLDDTLSYK